MQGSLDYSGSRPATMVKSKQTRVNVLLISTYEMGRQPFGLASPAAWLRDGGHQVTCLDLAVSPFPRAVAAQAEMIAFHLPMHTATRMAIAVLPQIQALNPNAKLVAYGLYAPINKKLLTESGVHTVLGAEFEADLAALADGAVPHGGLVKLNFKIPDRTGLPSLSRYAKLQIAGESRPVGYTEASRGCKHLCRHCPVVPVYQGQFRVVQSDVVLGDVRQQVAAGARHITFGDPDFFNGPTHARRIIEQLHREFPQLTYDVTIKVQHLLQNRELLPVLAATGCLFVTSAVESLDDSVLQKLEKHHTRVDFLEVVKLCCSAGLTFVPTFIAFTPWTTLTSYRDLLRTLAEEGLDASIAPVQLALRLLIPEGSRMLELSDVLDTVDHFDSQALVYRWRHRDPEVDALSSRLLKLVDKLQKGNATRQEIFAAVWQEASGAAPPEVYSLMPRATVPYLDEPWYC